MVLPTSSSISSMTIILVLLVSSYLMPTSKAAAASLSDARLAWGGKSQTARQNLGCIREALLKKLQGLLRHYPNSDCTAPPS